MLFTIRVLMPELELLKINLCQKVDGQGHEKSAPLINI